MASATITISGLTDTTGLGATDKASALRNLRNILQGVASGSSKAALIDVRASAMDAVRASAEVNAGSANGTCTINGVALAGDGADAAARAVDLAANVNASTNALIAGHVSAAVTASGKVTVSARTPGVTGNAITISVSGTGWSVTGGGARLASGAGGDGAAVTISL